MTNTAWGEGEWSRNSIQNRSEKDNWYSGGEREMWVKIKTLPRIPPNAGQEEKGGEVVEVSPKKHRLGEKCSVSISGVGGWGGRQLAIGFPSRDKEEQGAETTALEWRNLTKHLKGEVPRVTGCSADLRSPCDCQPASSPDVHTLPWTRMDVRSWSTHVLKYCSAQHTWKRTADGPAHLTWIRKKRKKENLLIVAMEKQADPAVKKVSWPNNSKLFF